MALAHAVKYGPEDIVCELLRHPEVEVGPEVLCVANYHALYMYDILMEHGRMSNV
jgi:hypothetical protein